MEIVVGTYEHYILGYTVKREKDYELQQTFASQAHLGPVMCLATSKKYLASGSVDETIKIFNMKTKKEVGSLIHHDGTITCLKFFEDSHLFSSSEDETICVWSTGNWKCLKTLRGHKSKVLSISIHPTGKLLLSVARDKSLRTWNLIKGRSAYITNVKTVAEFVHWSPDGVHFAVSINCKLDIYNVSNAGIVYTIDTKERILCLTFLSENIIAVGGESENIQVYDIKEKYLVNTFAAHSNRVKDLSCVMPLEMENETIRWLVSTSSDGFVKIWEICLEKLNTVPKKITEINTTCRPTCLVVWQEQNIIKEETKKSVEETQQSINEQNKKSIKKTTSINLEIDQSKKRKINEKEKALKQKKQKLKRKQIRKKMKIK